MTLTENPFALVNSEKKIREFAEAFENDKTLFLSEII